ncbi:hypothetical protein KSC_110930 [Ktedonobacter sp. SOSP1-52]|uniref:DUF2306 domain-containing protein n=1 Tax=Ktedonobacter sp. SOSP1-52 TaxID=2778366 RepID=UPI0019160CA8|nr:DUF2306 domain-containing protein [Ktedonobacter sp. SOSP1-52]GHO72201.1 hypothetical protein KSC_110930 [Ktedonobacter sp. SOSP1-52]
MDMQSTRNSHGGRVKSRIILWGLMALLAIGIAAYAAVPYLTLDPTRSRIPLNPAVTWHFTILVIHAVTGGVALLLGPWQFLPRLRARHPMLHRRCGLVYIVCVVIGSLAALYSAIVSVDGFVAQVGFVFLAVLWFYSVAQAYLAIRRGQVQLHRIWMARNYALTFAAVTLRIWLGLGIVVLVLTHNMHGAVTSSVVYVSAAWVSWVSTLVFTEWFINARLLRSLTLKQDHEVRSEEATRQLTAKAIKH